MFWLDGLTKLYFELSIHVFITGGNLILINFTCSSQVPCVGGPHHTEPRGKRRQISNQLAWAIFQQLNSSINSLSESFPLTALPSAPDFDFVLLAHPQILPPPIPCSRPHRRRRNAETVLLPSFVAPAKTFLCRGCTGSTAARDPVTDLFVPRWVNPSRSTFRAVFVLLQFFWFRLWHLPRLIEHDIA